MNYRKNKELAKTHNTEPSLTDQAGARETDINVIVRRFLKTGIAPRGSAQPMYGDYTELPGDFREMLEMAKGLNKWRKALPKELADIPTEELLALTPDEFNERLKQSNKPVDNQKGEPK